MGGEAADDRLDGVRLVASQLRDRLAVRRRATRRLVPKAPWVLVAALVGPLVLRKARNARRSASAATTRRTIWRVPRSRYGWGGGSPVIRCGVVEVEVVVGAVAAQGDAVGERLALAAGAADALLVVEALRRHVRHHHGAQRADVDADLHRGGDAEDVDPLRRARSRSGGCEQRALEAALARALLGRVASSGRSAPRRAAGAARRGRATRSSRRRSWPSAISTSRVLLQPLVVQTPAEAWRWTRAQLSQRHAGWSGWRTDDLEPVRGAASTRRARLRLARASIDAPRAARAARRRPALGDGREVALAARAGTVSSPLVAEPGSRSARPRIRIALQQRPRAPCQPGARIARDAERARLEPAEPDRLEVAAAAVEEGVGEMALEMLGRRSCAASLAGATGSGSHSPLRAARRAPPGLVVATAARSRAGPAGLTPSCDHLVARRGATSVAPWRAGRPCRRARARTLDRRLVRSASAAPRASSRYAAHASGSLALVEGQRARSSSVSGSPAETARGISSAGEVVASQLGGDELADEVAEVVQLDARGGRGSVVAAVGEDDRLRVGGVSPIALHDAVEERPGSCARVPVVWARIGERTTPRKKIRGLRFTPRVSQRGQRSGSAGTRCALLGAVRDGSASSRSPPRPPAQEADAMVVVGAR